MVDILLKKDRFGWDVKKGCTDIGVLDVEDVKPGFWSKTMAVFDWSSFLLLFD